MRMYEVGGCVRDELLGIPSKDIDFTFVFEDGDLPTESLTVGEIDPFVFMVEWLQNLGFKIFLETPEHLTVRAQFPPTHSAIMGNPPSGLPRVTADFVLARKEGTYSDGRRPDSVEPGTLEDDLRRRDFTMNAIAKDSDGNLIDLFGGVQDINDGVIRSVGNAFERLTEDALRAVRALRFSVTKGFRIDHEVAFAMESAAVLTLIETVISDERISDELSKMFRYDTPASLRALGRFPNLTDSIFSGRVSLDSTLKQKGRGQ